MAGRKARCWIPHGYLNYTDAFLHSIHSLTKWVDCAVFLPLSFRPDVSFIASLMHDLFDVPSNSPAQPKRTVQIHFDGGTPCNIPRLGYGIGYGSYRIDRGEVVRVNHGRPMSANAAEIFTLVSAIQQVVATHGRGVKLLVVGDSQIALKWARGTNRKGKPCKIAKGTSEEFRNAIQSLRDVLRGFGEVETEWNPRANSVRVFGH